MLTSQSRLGKDVVNRSLTISMGSCVIYSASNVYPARFYAAVVAALKTMVNGVSTDFLRGLLFCSCFAPIPGIEARLSLPDEVLVMTSKKTWRQSLSADAKLDCS